MLIIFACLLPVCSSAPLLLTKGDERAANLMTMMFMMMGPGEGRGGGWKCAEGSLWRAGRRVLPAPYSRGK